MSSLAIFVSLLSLAPGRDPGNEVGERREWLLGEKGVGTERVGGGRGGGEVGGGGEGGRGTESEGSGNCESRGWELQE